MGNTDQERLRLIRDAVQVLLEGYDVEWLRTGDGKLVGFSVQIPIHDWPRRSVPRRPKFPREVR